MSHSPQMTDYDKEMGAENKIQPCADFEGPVKNRRITDPLLFLLLIIAWGCTIAVGIWAYQNGDPTLLQYPKNYKGQRCGYDNVTDEANSTTTLPPQWCPVDYLANGACLSGCPQTTILNPLDRSELICKNDRDLLKMVQCTKDGQIIENPHALVICGGCMYQMESFNVFNYCVPLNFTMALDQISNMADSLNIEGFDLGNLDINRVFSVLENFVTDLYISKDLIFTFGFAGSAFMGFLMIFILRMPGLVHILVWTACLATPALIAIGGGFCYLIAQNRFDVPEYLQSETAIKAVEITAYVLWGLSGLIVCALIFLRKRINLSIGITKVACNAISDLPLSPFYPILQMLGYMVLIFLWCATMIYLSTCQSPVTELQEMAGFNIEYVSFVSSAAVKYLNWFMLFMLYWTSEYIIGIGQITLAMCFSKWYFTMEKGPGVKVSMMGSICVTFIKHSGTAALGGLILAFVRMVRGIFLYIHKKLKGSGMNNACIDAVMCCCVCCLCCVERCLKYIHKNAYIQTAIFGYPFCKAAREAFFLVLRNAARMFAVGVVSELAIIFCKLFIALAVGVSSFFALEWIYGEVISSILGTTIFISIVSWFVGNMFMEVLGIGITTILQCFIADEEMYPDGSYFVPDELSDFILKHAHAE